MNTLKLNVILGHLGEGLPCSVWRIRQSHRTDTGISSEVETADCPLSSGKLLHHHSGNFRTQTLTEVMLEVGADHILFLLLTILSRTWASQRSGSIASQSAKPIVVRRSAACNAARLFRYIVPPTTNTVATGGLGCEASRRANRKLPRQVSVYPIHLGGKAGAISLYRPQGKIRH